MRRARSQLNKLTQQQAGNSGGYNNPQGQHAMGSEIDEIQRRLNALQTPQGMAQPGPSQFQPQMQQPFQPQTMYNDPNQNLGFPQAMQSSGFHQSAPTHAMHQPQHAMPHQQAAPQQFSSTPAALHASTQQFDNVKSALEQMSSKLHAINNANSASSNNQSAMLQQSELLKQHYSHINAELQALKASISGISTSASSDGSLQLIQDTLNANFAAIMQQFEGSQSPQMDSSIFSSALEASHKELSQQIIDMKQSIDATLTNPNIYAKTLEVSHDDITKRLDDMHNALQTSIATPGLYTDVIEKNHFDLSQQILELQQVVEKAENGPLEISQPDFSSIEMRLEEITRAVVALSLDDGSINNLERIEARVSDMAKTLDGFSIPQAQSNDAGFDKLEAKLSDITNMMHSSSPDLSGVEMQLGNLSEKFENFSSVSLSAPISGDENNALLHRMDELVEQISQSQEHNNKPNEMIAHQLEQISGAIDKLSMPAAQNTVEDDATNNVIVQQLGQIADAIDQLSISSPTQSMHEGQFASLENQLTEISSQLNRASPVGEVSLEPIANRLSGIEEQLSANRDITIELAAKAAEDAVKMSVQAMPQMAAVAPQMDTDALNSMSQLLAQLNQETETHNSKNIEAFGEVTRTLGMMVERLGTIESGLANQNVAAPLIQEPIMQNQGSVPVAEVQNQFEEAELTQQPEIEAPIQQEEIPQRATSSASQLVKAARSAAENTKLPAHELAIEEVSEQITEPVVETNFEAAVDQFEGDELPVVETPDMSMETIPEVHREPKIETGPDIAIEPGTGGPDLAALVRQANDRRKNNKGAEADSSGTDFIAAARRAAQAAAQEAGAVEEEIEEKTKKSLFASLPELFAKRKKVIVMAAAAALLIALAVPIASMFMGGQKTELASVENNLVIEQSVEQNLPQASVVPSQNTVTPVEKVTPIETETEVEAVEDTQNQVTESASQELPQEVNLVNVNLNENPAPAKYLFPSELSVAPAELKTAIQNNEPAALFELGKLYTDGTSVGKDLAKAAQWYERSAELGFAPAQYIIGNFNEKGLGIEKNAAVAAEWYEQAAKGGNIIAMHNLAVLTATPNALSAEPDMTAAFKWFSNAADYGVRDSQVNAGIFHTKGFGTEVNLIEAYKWFAIAAKAGDKDAGSKRDVIANAIQPDQLEVAKELVKDWKPLDIVKAANEVPANEAWKSSIAVSKTPLKIDRNTIAQTQSLLSKVGFNAGTADGVMGQKTRNAIAAFQKKTGLPVTGRIDGQFLKSLKAVAT